MGRTAVWLIGFSLLSSAAIPAKRPVDRDWVALREQVFTLERKLATMEESLTRLSAVAEALSRSEAGREARAQEPPPDAAATFQEGYRLFLDKQYEKTIETLTPLVGATTVLPLADHALFWIAESYKALAKPDRALQYYQALYARYPFGNKTDLALYQIGVLLRGRGDPAGAMTAWNRLLVERPDSPLVSAARSEIDQIQPKRRKK
ncbi:MAG TPA: tetratricopeptide repeat protein [Candidatus Aminicenantes bacterium]|nr:tetratricopeptide repeat protein [Candidatus Aminicenantes bacterium]